MGRLLFATGAAIASGVLGLMASGSAAFAQTTGDVVRNYEHHHGSGMMWGGHQWGGFGMGFGFIFMLLLLAAVVVVIIFVVRAFGVGGMPNAPGETRRTGDTAVNILKERFAKGEIERDEFEEKRKLLE